jgi:hypothetical protein
MMAGTGFSQFTISGEFRPRAEYRDGYIKLRDSSKTPYLDILGRNRLIFEYDNEKFSAKFSFQQAYVFGENNYASDTITRNTINIYEGWFRYKFAKSFAIKIGRTELIYDDGRLFGNSNWSTRGTSHDVGIIEWQDKARNYRGDFGFAINNAAPASIFLASYPVKSYKYMAYVYEQRKMFKDQLTISMLAILDVFQKPNTTTTQTIDTLYIINGSNDTIGTTVLPQPITITDTKTYPTQLYGRFTIGGTAGFTKNKFKIFASGYYQTGRFNDGRKISAGMYSIFASYQVFKPLNLLIGHEILSGNDYSDTEGLKTKSTSFSTLYSSSHGFYGYMDLFTATTALGNGAGLTDLYLRANLKFSEKISLEGTFRYFGLQKGYLYAKGKNGTASYIAVDKHLGSEVDLMFVYKPVKNFEINTAYCFFLPTSTMEQFSGLKAGTSEWAQYAYIMLTYKPTFFNSEKN